MTRRREFERRIEELEAVEANRDSFPTDHDLELIEQARERQNQIAGGEEGRDRLLQVAAEEYGFDPEDENDLEKARFAYTAAVSSYALNNNVYGDEEGHETDMDELADEFRDELDDVLSGEYSDVLAAGA